MKAALGVVDGEDRLAQGLPRLSKLSRIRQRARDSGERPTPNPQLDVWIRPDVVDPRGNGGWTLHRNFRRAELDQVGAVSPPDDADALAARLTGLAPLGRDHAVAGRRPQ